jgi:hypothetical protein
MGEPPKPNGAKGQRVFISYSRADRQRVLGLVSLLEGLNHRVFMDERSIRAGRRWRDELEKELNAADVLLVFWTRHAARSDWVRHEYETFDARFPERPLVPVIGDSTPLTKPLQEHQFSDFYSLINELLATVRDLENTGASKRKIRAAVLKRLEEEGIHLPPDKRNRLFGFFGVLGFAMLPLHFLEQGRDIFVDSVSSLPSATYYAAGAAAVAGFVICHTFSGGEEATPSERFLVPDLFPVPIIVGQSGDIACHTQGMACVSVSLSPILDSNGKFFGNSTPPCSALVRRISSCRRDYGTDFALKGVFIRRSPDADTGALDLSSFDHFCLVNEKGKLGIYEFANCVKP